MAYELEVTNTAERDLLALSRKMRLRVDAKILTLADQPRPDGVVKLKGTKGDLWRVRVGTFRILYAVDDVKKIIEISRVLDRKEAYRGL